MDTKDNKLRRVEQHFIGKSHELYKFLDEYSFLSKNLYNKATYTIRQVFITTSRLSRGEYVRKEELLYLDDINKKVDEFNKFKKENYEKRRLKALKDNKSFNSKLVQIDYFGKDKKYIGLPFLEFLFKDTEWYRAMNSQTSQQILKFVDANWVSYFKLVKDYNANKEKYSGVPQIPNYKNSNGRYVVIFTNQTCKIKDGNLKFPKALSLCKINTNVKREDFQQVRVTPKGKNYILDIVYNCDKFKFNLNYDNVCSIDIGVVNLATLTNNIGLDPVVINGRTLKSINQYYNKCRAKVSSDLKKRHDMYWSNELDRLATKRFFKIKDYMHKASKIVIEYCIDNNIGTIVIGHNKKWKSDVDMGKISNQNFVHIPFNSFIKMIRYKGEEVGINVIETEEKYTSGTSFLDNEDPCREYYNNDRRIKRGMFKSNDGILINSDVNASYQIMKKVVPNAFANGIEGVGLHPIRVNIH